MEANKAILVKSHVNYMVIASDPMSHFKREWAKKNATYPIPFSVLQELMYDSGFEYFIKQGILSIEDEEARVALGLQAPGEANPSQMLTEEQIKRYLTIAPLAEFKEKVPSFPKAQVDEMVAYAIEHDLMDVNKDEILKKLTGKDIIRAIQLKKAAQED